MKLIPRVAGFVAMMFLFMDASAAQDLEQPLFSEATAAMKQAQSVQADLYAPRSYERGMRDYKSAQQRFARGARLDYIRSQVSDATTYLLTAAKTSQHTQTVLAALIKTRHDAMKVNAAGYAEDLWRHGEDRFHKAIDELERGADKYAMQDAAEADKYYRDGELIGIKATYLSGARRLIAKAEKDRIYRRAPKTLEHAKSLLAQADKALDDNRYDTDLPRSLARQAQTEVKHAMYLSNYIEHADDKDMTMEDVILDWETPVRKIAAAADMSTDLSDGYSDATKKIVDFIEQQQTRTQKLDEDNNQLKNDVAQLKQMLSGASEQRTALNQRLQEQARERERLEKVEGMFTRDEARVLRETNSIILRLVGLNFDSGKATIEARNYQLLAKVQGALAEFPNSRFVIEGHTDSYGSDVANYNLSQRRADAVKQYLIANMHIDPSRLEATGYGETKPIATNDTVEGRARNRRIDIIIRPKLLAAAN